MENDIFIRYPVTSGYKSEALESCTIVCIRISRGVDTSVPDERWNSNDTKQRETLIPMVSRQHASYIV
jgi:hypothetical protein